MPIKLPANPNRPKLVLQSRDEPVSLVRLVEERARDFAGASDSVLIEALKPRESVVVLLFSDVPIVPSTSERN